MNIRKLAQPVILFLLVFSVPISAQAETADETDHPVIFAHGMAGWDSIVGYSYFGEDVFGTFVGDACGWFELNGCNDWIAYGQQANQKAEAFQVTSLHSSELRGTELYNHLQNFMATTGHTKVNLVGHSQGGMDIRKAAHMLKSYYGTPKVGAMISLSSPHRGSPYPKGVLDLYSRDQNNIFCGALPANPDGSDPCLAVVADIADVLFNFGTGATTDGNDIIASGLQLVYEDYDAGDGVLTGAKVFNENYGSEGVAGYVGSIITAQDNFNKTPLAAAISVVVGYEADADGYCVGDCNNDGAAGQGDGSAYDMDDDGLVGINSQQMGTRLQYTADDWECRWYGCWNPLDTISEVSSTGYVADLNNPSATQMTSHAGTLNQDHLDVLSLGPDDLDEEEFYAAIFDFIEKKGF